MLFFLAIAIAIGVSLFMIKRNKCELDEGCNDKLVESEYPPGPPPFPLVGNFPQIDLAQPHKTMNEWKERYGEVFTVYLPKPVVVLAGARALHEALVQKGEHFTGRPTTYLYTLFTRHSPDGDGIILCRGPRWQAQRRIALRAFRGFGMGKKEMEARIMHHARIMIKRTSAQIKKNNNGLITDLHYALAYCFGNIIHDLVMGTRFEHDDGDFFRFKRMLDHTLEGVASVEMLLVNSFPWMRHILPRFRRYVSEGFALQNFFKNEIERHAKALKEGEIADNFIDFYLKAMKEEKQPYLNEWSCAINSGDLWTGGLETVVTTIRWAIIYFIHYPAVQKKIQAELDTVVGRRPLTLADRQHTPYFHAAMDEIQRIVNVLPWHIPHTCDKEVSVCGVLIPKDSIIMPQPGAVFFDPKIFPDPYTLRPERFLDKTGNYKPHPDLNAFGLGKRACPGEALARVELYLVLGSMLQDLEFRADPRLGMPSLERCTGMTAVPNPTLYMVVQRFERLLFEE
ncbi:unnamed protein product [Bursaphelenchus xylophilus]|uniref:(pine wood nematode) hypothetical protein n=1 Tax=Bursaphelenchus xylophilus TaxID=6326 RepID=D2XV62_BURXY|nr:DAF-9 [Bursaphelenchus xylophilus]CAD5235021.1 unnamed protein product [Bursaphelenchus xylophilus]CAG9131146.1 unnamed protein product [Bursaphelenchus xylophilus]